ncbi:MAG: fused MFS/spermidine synthase [Chloroflexi bacterium]|nr:fused MFS/spermidine synthase [Chloroflexota bacterium]
MRSLRTWLVILVVFVGGMASLGIEMSASRLLAPYFGTSLIIWAILVGLVLLYLTLGYYLGGKWADQSPQESTLFQILAWAGFWIGLIPLVSQPILRASLEGFATLNAGIFIGTLFAVISLFAPPVLLLGCVSPFAIRLLLTDIRQSGHLVGRLYAISTLGSIVGTFLPVLILIPQIGTRATFIFFALTLLATALLGVTMLRSRLATLYAVLILLVLGIGFFTQRNAIKNTPNLIFEKDSPYQYVQIVQEGSDTLLLLNEGQGTHSSYNPQQILTGGIWDFFLISPFFAPGAQEQDVQSLALIGSAAGTVAQEYTQVYGPILIDGAEIDPEVVMAGRKYFAMNEPNFNVHVADGRTWLKLAKGRYSVIAIDAYRQPYIPFHLTTLEFFQEVRDHLTPNGTVAINVGRTETDFRLVDALAYTMQQVFPSVYVIDSQDSINSIVVATLQPSQLADFETNVARLQNPYLRNIAGRTLGNISFPPTSGQLFTDDRAPVEQLTDRIILDYALGRTP